MASPAISAILPDNFSSALKTSTSIQNLWSGYGYIYRLNLHTPPKTLILKSINPPLNDVSESHKRKLISYRVERHFYHTLATRLPPSVKVAAAFDVNPKHADQALLLEDLSPQFPQRAGSLTKEQAEVVLRWLSRFHGTFWGVGEESGDVKPPLEVAVPMDTHGVWQNGGYWYLDTRSEEYQDMAEDPENEFLMRWARKVADWLGDTQAPGRVILHGDLKGANIVFSRDWKKCACYDFQYCGKGLGVVDMVYFLGTAVQSGVMGRKQDVDDLLSLYYEELRNTVGDGLGQYTKDVMLEQLDWAVVDWYRFMAGWGMWGNSWVSKSKVKGIIRRWDAEGR